jgi:hypothetical protein
MRDLSQLSRKHLYAAHFSTRPTEWETACFLLSRTATLRRGSMGGQKAKSAKHNGGMGSKVSRRLSLCRHLVFCCSYRDMDDTIRIRSMSLDTSNIAFQRS